MNTENSFSSLPMSEKRKKLMAMVDMRKKMKMEKAKRPLFMLENGDKIISKKAIRGKTKKKKFNAHSYKKMFKKRGPKTYENIIENVESKDENIIENIDEHGSNKGIEEYWVPVHLSRMQMEQYCSLLHSNFEEFSSSLRDTSSLHDILTQTQKCCDHPYLVNPNLRESLKTNTPDDQLDAEINASGKLQLLDKLLLEIKRCGLRVLVLFQSMGTSKQVSIGDILDDLVHNRLGQNSYVRIHPKISTNSERDKRKEDLKSFNNLENGKSVCLMEYRACHSAIKISCVDVVILFNSDVNPLNDLKALHKLTLDSRERLRVFRFYSSFTIEEKALMLSKQGMNIIDKATCCIKYNFYHRLLAWGVSKQLSTLSKDQSSNPESNSKSNSCFVDALIHDLSSLLMNKNENSDRLKSSIVSNAPMLDGSYSKEIVLLGEIESEICLIEDQLMENEPIVFWTKLFKETPWKNSSSRVSRRVHKSFRNPNYLNPDYLIEGFQIEKETVTENLQNDATKSPCVKTRSRRKRRRRTNPVEESPDIQPQSQPPQTPTVTPPVSDQFSNATLKTELENIKKEQDEITNLHEKEESMLVSECEKKILEIRKKYEALIDEKKMCATTKKKVLEEYYDLVYANKVLAETLAKTCDDNFNEEKPEKESNPLKIAEIPASALVQSKNRCTNRITGGQSFCGTGIIRAPAPHLRSSPSLFASLPNLSNSQTEIELKNVMNEVNTENMPLLQSTHLWPEVLSEFDSLLDMGFPNLPFLDGLYT